MIPNFFLSLIFSSLLDWILPETKEKFVWKWLVIILSEFLVALREAPPNYSLIRSLISISFNAVTFVGLKIKTPRVSYITNDFPKLFGGQGKRGDSRLLITDSVRGVLVSRFVRLLLSPSYWCSALHWLPLSPWNSNYNSLTPVMHLCSS